MVPTRIAVWAIALFLPILAGACGGDAESSGEQFVNNARGGATRANNYSGITTHSVSTFAEVTFDSLGAGFLGAPLATNFGHIAAVAGKRQLALIRYDSLRWVYQFPEGEYPLPELSCDSVGTIYAVTTNRLLCAVDSGGKFLWKQPIAASEKEAFDLPTWPVVIPGGIIAGTTDGYIKRFDFAGKEIWSVQRGADIVRTTAYSPEIGIAIGVTYNDYGRSDTLVLLDENGKQKWSAPLENLRIEYGPIVVADQIVIGAAGKDVKGDYTPVILTFDGSGKEAWRASLKVLPLGIACDADGNVYISGGGGSQFTGGVVSSFDPNGKLRWEISLTESIPSAPVTTSGRVCFVAVRDKTLGLYSYNLEGGFISFAPIESLVDITPIPVVLPYGTILLAGQDRPVMLKGR